MQPYNRELDSAMQSYIYCSMMLYFLFQVDPNTGVAMYESDAIVKYLVTKYGAYTNFCFYLSDSLLILYTIANM